MLSNLTVRECVPMQAVKQPVTLDSFNHWQALKTLLFSDKLWLVISKALFIFIFISLHWFYLLLQKEKSKRIVKLEKPFWYLTTLIAFVVAYIISITQTGFLMANASVHRCS